ncbi:MAG: hypothetical protein Q9202_006861 [Teloschistes flavicans]
MSLSSAPATLSTLKRLSPSVLLSEPALDDITQQQAVHDDQPEIVTTSHSSTSNHQKLIILFTWMSAHPKHILKYVEGYRTRYPNAKILVVKSSPADLFYRRSSTQRRWLAPVVKAIESFSCTDTGADEPQIGLHIFSNGGCYQARSFFLAYRAATTAAPFPTHSKIFDSSPGRATFKRSVLALSSGLPRAGLTRVLLLALIYIVMSAYCIIVVPFGLLGPIERTRNALNDRDLMQGERERFYVYSEMDPMVGWADVEAHAQDASKKGFEVRCEKFQGTGHCAHVRADDGVRYWNIVHSLWDGGEEKTMAAVPNEDVCKGDRSATPDE